MLTEKINYKSIQNHKSKLIIHFICISLKDVCTEALISVINIQQITSFLWRKSSRMDSTKATEFLTRNHNFRPFHSYFLSVSLLQHQFRATTLPYTWCVWDCQVRMLTMGQICDEHCKMHGNWGHSLLILFSICRNSLYKIHKLRYLHFFHFSYFWINLVKTIIEMNTKIHHQNSNIIIMRTTVII